MKDIERLLSQMAEQGYILRANPDTIRQLLEEGVLSRRPQARTQEESINVLFEERKKSALGIAKELPYRPLLGYPSVDYLYYQVWLCMIFGLNVAAVTLCGVLVEYVLKYVAYTRKVGGFAKYDPQLWEKYQGKSFGAAIQAADKEKLLTPELKTDLKSFNDDIRNPYTHYNITKVTKGVVAGKVRIINLQTGEMEEKDIPAVESFIVQDQAKPFVDSSLVFDVFAFADETVRYLLDQLEA